jgi:hypothetical protein
LNTSPRYSLVDEIEEPRLADTPGTAIYGCRVCITRMTRKSEMKKGYVARTFHIPTEVDDELRVMAIRNHVRFSDMAILSFKHHLQANKVDRIDKK